MNNIIIKNFIEKYLSRKGYPSFWFVNSFGWIVFVAIDTFIVSPEIVLSSWNNLFENTLEWSTGYLSTIGLRALYIRFPYKTKSLIIVLGFTLISSFVVSVIMISASHVIYFLLNPVESKQYLDTILSFSYLALRLTQVLPLVTSWSLLYFGIKFWMDWSKERDRAEKLDLLAQSAQLQMLRYQVNPHFLFNSFSSLRALIRTNKDKAEEMVSKLSEFYRYSLTSKNNTEVPLIEEIDAIEHYFEIEKIRFGDKLEIDISIDPLAEEYPVPCFLIHPLAENAIKYGMKTSTLPLKIKIDAYVKKNKLIICVANSGKWVKHANNINVPGTNTGLDNIKSRLDYSFPNNHRFYTKEEDGYVIVFIEIQKEL